MSTRRSGTRSLLLGCGAIALLAAPAADRAQTARSGGDAGANAQLVQQLQQLGSERTALEGENAHLKSQLESVRRDRDALKSGKESDERKFTAVQAVVAKAVAVQEAKDKELAAARARLEEYLAKTDENERALEQAQATRAAVGEEGARHRAELDECAHRNERLYAVSGSLLDDLDAGGHRSAARSDPFIAQTRDELAHYLDDYLHRPASSAPATLDPGR
jgi:chromosome segregation ATPase